MLLSLTILLLSALIVCSSNVVYALVLLVLAFFLSGALLIWQGTEFLGYILIVVYVGAIAVLFLFVVMTLDVDREGSPRSPSGLADYAPQVAGALLAAFSVWSVWAPARDLSEQLSRLPDRAWFDPLYYPPFASPEAIALILYSSGYAFLFASGLLLLVAMIGAVLLVRPGAKPRA